MVFFSSSIAGFLPAATCLFTAWRNAILYQKALLTVYPPYAHVRSIADQSTSKEIRQSCEFDIQKIESTGLPAA